MSCGAVPVAVIDACLSCWYGGDVWQLNADAVWLWRSAIPFQFVCRALRKVRFGDEGAVEWRGGGCGVG